MAGIGSNAFAAYRIRQETHGAHQDRIKNGAAGSLERADDARRRQDDRVQLLRTILGKPLDFRNREVFHKVSLIAFFAWVGLGADGLSSSAYGPEEAFRQLAGHEYLAVFLAIAMAATVLVISASYSGIIDEFPTGGGGYVVTSKLLGASAGAVSGCALLVDYVLTISISIAAGANALFAFLPPAWADGTVAIEVIAILLLIVMNLRGVKESVVVLTPIFLVFLLTHVILIVGVVIPHASEAGEVAGQVRDGLSHDLDTIGLGALLLVFARAYSLGGGTFTGIEAVSNGLQIMREPRAQTGRRTMVMMGISLAFTAGGILLCYLLLRTPVAGNEPMNAALARQFWGGGTIGHGLVILTLVSEAALLFVAAQAGFIDGPRVMANMSIDSWFPHQLAALSERLTMRNGVFLMGGAAIATLVYTAGDVHTLVVMYSINVFLTFSMSNLAMAKLWFHRRREARPWKRRFGLHLLALTLCTTILSITVIEKFTAGGWKTLLVTAALIAACAGVRRHYRKVGVRVRRLDAQLIPLEQTPDVGRDDDVALDPAAPTAVVLVGGYSGLGLHTLMRAAQTFPGQFHQVVFISAGIIDSGSFKGADAVDRLRDEVGRDLRRYVRFARTKLGWRAASELAIGVEAVEELERLARDVHGRFPGSVFFAGQLVFREPSPWDRLFHNMTAFAVQRRLQFDNLPMVVLPVRVLG
jgi:amino acid transporter